MYPINFFLKKVLYIFERCLCRYKWLGLIVLASCSESINVNINSSTPNVSSNVVSDSKVVDFDIESEAIIYYSAPVDYNPNIRKWQGCSSIISDKEGVLYAAWFSGGKGEDLGNYITVSLSKDNGQKWEDNQLIIAPINDSVRHIDPVFWKDQLDSLHLSWTKSDGMWDGGEGGIWHVMMTRKSNRLVITKPEKLFHGIMNTKPIISSNNEMLFPVFGWNFQNLFWNGHTIRPTIPQYNGAFVYVAKKEVNKNRSFSFPTKLSQLPIPLNLRWADEHMLVEIKSNNYICVSRGMNGALISKSVDACKTWNVAQPFISVGSTSESKSFLCKLASGNLLFIGNMGTDSKSRSNLTAFISEDYGTTWKSKLVIDTRNNVSYPDAFQSSDGIIHIIYDRDRYVAKEIIHVALSESDIRSQVAQVRRDIISK